MALTTTELIDLPDGTVRITDWHGDAGPPECDGCHTALNIGDIVLETNPPDCGCDVFVHPGCTPRPHNHPPPTLEQQAMLDRVFGSEH